MQKSNVVVIADDFEVRDEVYKLISHLHAQAMMICGEGLENFSNHNDDIKSNYLWSICDLAERSLVLLGRLRSAGEAAAHQE